MLDFSFDYFVQYLDINDDYKIQKEELGNFLKTQDNNIFTQYLNFTNEDIPADIFKQTVDNHITKKEDIEKFNKTCENYLHYYRNNGYNYESDEKFNIDFNKYLNILQKTNNNYEEAQKVFLQKNTSAEAYLKRMNSGKFENLWDFGDYKLKNTDLKKYPLALKHVSFKEKTFADVSQENLPEDFKPKEIFEKGKSIGLGIDDIHKMGYTGKNTSFAIIDTGTICKNGKQHNALNFKEYYIPDAEKNPDGKTKHDLDNFHGQATSYIAQEIAPQADLYYYAQSNTGNNENVLAENLQAIINKNKTLPDNKKIRVVSMSFSFNQDNPKILEKVKELEKQGVWVFSAQEFEKDFNCCEKKDPTGDINDFNNYQMYYYEKNENGSLYINSGNRTVPDPESPDTFRHDYVGSISWGVPVVAGYYTLACQADTSMTPQKFKELASKTARIIESTNPVVNNCFLNIGRTKETTKIKMIDIKALLQAIEQEKINSNSLF